VDPAAHRARIAAQQLGDGAGGLAAGRQQDHDQAQAHAVWAVQRTEHIAGAACRAGEGFGVHADRTHTDGGLVGSVVLWKASATREATSLLRSLGANPAVGSPGFGNYRFSSRPSRNNLDSTSNYFALKKSL
jgi:hypothetical protein